MHACPTILPPYPINALLSNQRTLTLSRSAARLWQLKAICMQYPGPISAVLYVGSLKSKVLHEHGECRVTAVRQL